MRPYYCFLNKLALAEIIIIILGTMFVLQGVRAATPTPEPLVCWVIDADLVNSISLPKNPEELKLAYKNLPYHDVVLDMLYYTRLRSMRHTEKDDLDFLRSMPKNPIEFWFLYYVTTPEIVDRFPQLNSAYATYFEVLADLVIQHPEFLETYLLQAYFSDGEVAERLEISIRKIEKAIPKKFNSALKKLPIKVRVRINIDS